MAMPHWSDWAFAAAGVLLAVGCLWWALSS